MADALLVKTLVVILASVCAISLVAHIRLPTACAGGSQHGVSRERRSRPGAG
jgi:hypothetical protein